MLSLFSNSVSRHDWELPVGDLELTPARIALVYLFFGVSALYVSDVLLVQLVDDPLLAQLQAVKGFVEIIATALLIYALTKHSQRSLRATNDRLESAREELGVLHRVLRHNLRNDMTVISGYATHLEEQLTTPTLETHCEKIRASCDKVIDYTEKAKLVAQLDANGVETSRIDVATTLSRVCEQIRERADDADVAAKLPPSVTVEAHQYLEFAVRELLENAVVHNDATTPTVSVTAEEVPGNAEWVRIYIEDNGPGLPAEEMEAIHQSDEQPLRHGTGLGLWVAKWIVTRSEGEFEIENRRERGCRVTITLPEPGADYTPYVDSRIEDFVR